MNGRPGNGNGNGNGSPGGYGGGRGAGEATVPVSVESGVGAVAAMPFVSPRRTGTEAASLPRLAPAEPIATYTESPEFASAAAGAGAPEAEEPPLPDEQRSVAAFAAQAPSRPIEAAPGAVLNVRFAREAGTERVVLAMQAFKALLRERPGLTRVVVHVPAPGGSALPMELRGVAYDAELVAEVHRRVGDAVIELNLG